VAPALERISSPLAGVLRVISARWGPLVMEALASDHVRFNDLHRHLTGVNHKVLIETLRLLQREDIVRRVTVADPAQNQDVTEYRLTDIGRELLSWIDEVRIWAERRAQFAGPQ
jgi:DNA-binding HxlR family transcriptional regulator